jgi:DNA-binding NarL/FixJ family response regulator
MSKGKTARSSKPKAKIFLLDDHAVTRFGLTQLINQEPDMIVCGEAESAPQGLTALRKLKPDLVILDLSLKEGSGIEFIQNLDAQSGGMQILIVSMHDEELNAELALRAGARGYIMKEQAIRNVLAAIRTVLSGKIYLSEKMTARLIEQRSQSRPKAGAQHPIDLLSPRELQVFQMIGQWTRTAEIASRLGLSPRTVEFHRYQIKQKLHLKNGTELTHYATEFMRRKK